MDKISEDENETQETLDKTKKNINKLKNSKKRSLFSMIFGGLFRGIGGLLVPVLGGLILISLARIGLRKWKKTYMPKSDGSTATIFGIKIPNWGGIKAIGMGLWNFFNVGLVNMWDRLKLFFGNIHNSLFGKKGAFKDMIETKNSLRKIFWAFVIGLAKKAWGWIVDAICLVLDIFLPGSGRLGKFLLKLIPAVFTFISTQIMLAWSNKKAAAESNVEQMKQAAKTEAGGAKMLKKLKS